MAKRNISYHRGFSITELAFALLVIGAILAVVWQKTGDVYRGYDVMLANQQLERIVNSIRRLSATEDITDFDNLDLTGLSPDLIGSFQGKKIVYNPWHGHVSIFIGNAMGWGLDKNNKEYTIRMDNVPAAACTELVMRSTDAKNRNENMVAAYIAPTLYQGKIMCFKTDEFCLNTVNGLNRDTVDYLCSEHDRMTVMFTYIPS